MVFVKQVLFNPEHSLVEGWERRFSSQGTKLKNKYSRKIIKWTMPCNSVVLPMARVSAPIKNDRYIKVIFKLLMPRLNGRLKQIAIAATVGMVSPMLAKADPKAKLRLL